MAAPRTRPAPAPRPAPVRDFPITSAQISEIKITRHHNTAAAVKAVTRESVARVSVWRQGRSWRDGGDGVRDAAQDACLVRQIRDIFRYGEKVAFVCSLLEVKKKNSD